MRIPKTVTWVPVYRRAWVCDKHPPLHRKKPIALHLIRKDGKLDGFQAQFFNRRLMTFTVYHSLNRVECG